MRKGCVLAILLLVALNLNLAAAQTIVNGVIDQPLTVIPGDALRGRTIVASRQTGLCLLCHSGPFPEERFQGNLAPELSSSVARYTAPQLRARIVDTSHFNSNTIMPAYYRTDLLNRVAPKFVGQTILSGQEIEDVVAFLLSLNTSVQ
ncbi:sulfur oxidation c-type cytochrome SoxX [Polynucleobacter wuianus]|uniref:Sulfur oxidation c-type cytochrome SoxX n=2 Tax=Polynucleobacter wuianus TaxID=1743168 RepID=A0A191UIN1_9BURK|nr:sulfur oxidation c-type cytochrome SoxX [Polynucleobacter wuianus]ANJ00761.1 sulfur oxidation c-type cytochrome SoxX [Polynucleobacter wuianus]MBU3552559.1 sulfur oxidation c-type cytochrome SoxX [Polynucleobacter sp. MWH-Post4-6-1]MBU3610468.1 sulfur oxidation c-type cytochrome SoxX [Polynucleobacter wuianus]